MAVIQQVAFEIPAEIAVGLASGKYIQWGGVVRDSAGHIVKHLKPAIVDQGVGENAIKLAANKMMKNPKLILAGVAAAGAAALGTFAVKQIRKNRRQKETPAVVLDFQRAMGVYVDAAKAQSLNEAVVANLLKAISEIEKTNEHGDIVVEVSLHELRELITMITDYTERLAKANNVHFVTPKGTGSPNGSFKVLRICLEQQREILQAA